jgi:hypothetical protein
VRREHAEGRSHVEGLRVAADHGGGHHHGGDPRAWWRGMKGTCRIPICGAWKYL